MLTRVRPGELALGTQDEAAEGASRGCQPECKSDAEDSEDKNSSNNAGGQAGEYGQEEDSKNDDDEEMDDPAYPVHAHALTDPHLAASQAHSALTLQAYDEFSALLVADPATCIEKFRGSFFDVSKSAHHRVQAVRSGVLIIESLAILHWHMQTRHEARDGVVKGSVPLSKKHAQNQTVHEQWVTYLLHNMPELKAMRQ